MNDLNLKNSLDLYLEQVEEISVDKQYWLIRTQSGALFDSFMAFNYVSIGHEKISYSKIYDLKKVTKNQDELKNKLKNHVEKIYPDSQPGLIAGQVIRFIYEVKEGDVVIIPSEGSEYVSFGIVQSSALLVVDDILINRTKCNYTKRKGVNWIKTLSRDNLDPFLYKVLQAHQAINDISKYDSIIERSIGDFYKLNNETNLIVNVLKKKNIKANNLLFFGSDLLRLADNFIQYNSLDIDISEVDIKININSEGKAQFLSKNGKLILIIGLIIIGLNGGGLKIQTQAINVDLSTDGLIQKIIDFIDTYHDKQMINSLMINKDSLEIKDPEDLIDLVKQFSSNKDIPK